MFGRRIGAILLVGSLTGMVAACGPDVGDPVTGEATQPATPMTTSSPPVGSTATAIPVPEQLRFTAKTIDDQSFTGESLAGTAAVLWFWAPWCPKCRAEASRVAAAAQAHSGKITFVGVAAQDQVPAMKKFVADYKVAGFQHLADLDASIWTRFGVTQQPAYAFISPDGKVDVVKQQLSETALTERVSALAKA
nr:redoxin domain-containing protein [Kibdelosporangium sp. MJ126-NF4]CEL17567.1 PROBABLE CONSERVED LIPOPROTEIN DSBF [Kibdelosporangium sp. MJ126-NF4]CTQ91206.1 PROBABLE CONSERVED LIPOPROTEIN DSBF [Kibdelosporangium sp. MJ126-NF4]